MKTTIPSRRTRRRTSITPRWLNLADAGVYSGLGSRVLETYGKLGILVVSKVRRPGAVRGKTLVMRESLDALILAGLQSPLAEHTDAAAPPVHEK